jgi:hypothetical protein
VVVAERIASSFSRRVIKPASRKNAPRRFYANVWLRGNAHEISLADRLTASGLTDDGRAHVTTGHWGQTLHGAFKPESQPESSHGEMSGEHLGNLLRQVSKASVGEIDGLLSELQTLQKKLQTDGDRIQRDIAEHAELSQQVMQLTKIISDSVKKLPGRSG